MIKISIIVVLNLILIKSGFGQIDIPYIHGKVKHEKIDSNGRWMTLMDDTAKLVFVGKDKITYKVYDKRSTKLLIEGELGRRLSEDMWQGRMGKWSEYYENGKLKTTGYYYDDHSIGTWQLFYPNGKPKETFSISYIQMDSFNSSYCRTGSYQEFYENGKLKINGFYKVCVDTITVEGIDPGTAEKYPIVVYQPVSKKYGIWSYYTSRGILYKKEEYPY